MRIGLDATYSIDKAPTGVAVYSQQILAGVAASGFAEQCDWFYRSRKFWRARKRPHPANASPRFLHDWIGDRSADLFHGLNQRLPARRFRKQIATFHDLFVLSAEYSTADFRARFAEQARNAAAAADLVIAVSAFTASQIQEYLHVPASRIRVVHHGVTPRTIPDVPREKVVLCVGAIQKRKNQPNLVRAFESMPTDWSLVLAGSAGFGATATTDAVAKSPSRDRILVTGYVTEPELSEWYGKASIFAFPSFDEGFGIPILEAMAAGIPVVTSDRSALPEVAGTAALTINPSDTDELAAALNELASNETRRAQLQQLGLERAKQFTWQKAVEETLAVYRELLT